MKKKMIFISPGPVFRPENVAYQSHYKNLSKEFEGHIYTASMKRIKIQIGEFKFNAVKSNFTFFSNIKFMLFCIFNAFILRMQKKKIDLVITYDPIKTGLIGVFFSMIVGAKFSPEVNGVYTSDAEWLDLPNSRINRIKKKVIPKIIRYVLKKSDGIKLLFKEQINTFSKDTKGKVIRHFPCFVPTAEFSWVCEKKEILFAGFPFKRKGVDVLINAFKKISANYPEWRLKILGWFPDTTELEMAINQHSQIFHHPPVHFHEMPDQIGSCAILVLPSRSEAMGRVLVEAMAAGKPRIGSKVDGIPNVINDGVDGFLFESENIDDLSKKLDLLMGSKELRRKMGKAGMLRVQQEFTENKYIENTIEFYNEILNRI